MKKTIKNIVSLVLLSFAVFLLSGCVYWVDPYGNSHPSRGWSGYSWSGRGNSQLQLQQCVESSITRLNQEDYWVEIDGGSILMTREQKAEADCLQSQAKIEEQRIRNLEVLIDAEQRIQKKRVQSIRSFHQRCEAFGADIVGRWEAGCPLSPQNKRELWNRGYDAW